MRPVDGVRTGGQDTAGSDIGNLPLPTRRTDTDHATGVRAGKRVVGVPDRGAGRRVRGRGDRSGAECDIATIVRNSVRADRNRVDAEGLTIKCGRVCVEVLDTLIVDAVDCRPDIADGACGPICVVRRVRWGGDRTCRRIVGRATTERCSRAVAEVVGRSRDGAQPGGQ